MTALTVRSNWKPKLCYSFKKLKEMLSFSMTLMADSFMIWFTSYAGTFIVSRCLTSYYVGIYKTGITTISTYINLAYTIMAPVFFAGLSRCQNDKKECDRLYYSFQRYAAILIIPLGVGVFVYRDFVTLLLLGKQWNDAALILGGIALIMPFTVLTAQLNSDYYRALGKPLVALCVQSAYAVVMVAVLLQAVKMEFNALCIVRAALPLTYVAISTAVICIKFKVSIFKILSNLFYPVLASVIMGGAAFFLRKISSSFAWNIISAFICVIIYFAIIVAIPKTRREVVKIPMINKALTKITGRMPNEGE